MADASLEPSKIRGRKRKQALVALLVLCAVLVFGVALFLYWTRHGAGNDSPRIGLSVSDDWYDDLGFHRAAYDVALARAGARVVTLRPSDHAGKISEILDDLDGVVLAGGGDVSPSFYGGVAAEGFLVDAERDRFEIALITEATKRKIPILGICRGVQILAVAFGGTLRDLRADTATSERHGVTLKSLSAHDVRIADGTRLAEIIGVGPHPVNSFHAQAVESPGTLTVCARADDGVIEAIEGPNWIIGIQWHPELLGVLDDTQHAIIEALVEEAR